MSKNYPRSYADANEVLGKQYSKSLPSVQTCIYRSTPGCISLQYHDTDVVRWCASRNNLVRLDTGGYMTKTTKSRINAALPAGWSVYQEKFDWYIAHGEETWRWDGQPVYIDLSQKTVSDLYSFELQKEKIA